MKIRQNRIISYLATFISMISLFIGTDLFKGNVSGSTNDIVYMIKLWIFGISLSTCVNGLFKEIDKRSSFFSVLWIIIAVILPYDRSLIILADLHVLFGYIGFFGLTSTYMYILFRYQTYNRKLADVLISIFSAIIISILALYMVFLGVNGLMELIYLFSLVIISLIIELDYARISDGNKR